MLQWRNVQFDSPCSIPSPNFDFCNLPAVAKLHIAGAGLSGYARHVAGSNMPVLGKEGHLRLARAGRESECWIAVKAAVRVHDCVIEYLVVAHHKGDGDMVILVHCD